MWGMAPFGMPHSPHWVAVELVMDSNGSTLKPLLHIIQLWIMQCNVMGQILTFSNKILFLVTSLNKNLFFITMNVSGRGLGLGASSSAMPPW